MPFLLAEPPRWSSGRAMRAVKDSLGHSFKEMYRELEELSSTRAVEATPAGSLNASATEELSPGLGWPVSLVPPVSHVSGQRNYTRSEGLCPSTPYHLSL